MHTHPGLDYETDLNSQFAAAESIVSTAASSLQEKHKNKRKGSWGCILPALEPSALCHFSVSICQTFGAAMSKGE